MRPNKSLKNRRILASKSFDHLTPEPLLKSTQDPADLPIMRHDDQVDMIGHDHIRDDIEPQSHGLLRDLVEIEVSDIRCIEQGKSIEA